MRTSESNMEHFRNELLELAKKNESFAVMNGKIFSCDAINCNDCDFNKAKCSVKSILWLMADYKPEPMLTHKERAFLDFAETGYIARDENGRLYFYGSAPVKKDDYWNVPNGDYLLEFDGFNDLFDFITWEDEKPWSIENLRKLKVKDEE